MPSPSLEGAAPPSAPRPAAPVSAPSAVRAGSGGVRGALKRVVGGGSYAAVRSLYRLANKPELQLPYSLGFKLRTWARGFKVENAVIYGLHRPGGGVDASEFVNDFDRIYRCDRLNPVGELFDQKLLLRRVLADRGFVQPETVAHITRHAVIADPLEPGARHVTRRAMHDRLVAEGGRYILKPQDGTYGRGIALLDVRDGVLVAQRGTTVRPYDLERDAPPNSLVERAVRQHEFWERVSPASVNTLRILTLWTPGDAEPFVAKVIQRFGTVQTLPTDNWDGGGLLSNVDLATGRLDAGRINPFKTTREDRPYAEHPDTGVQIEGEVLPFWDQILDTTLRAARSLPMAAYVGWDVAVDPEGRALFIEGNRNTGVRSLQIGRGLLADPAVRRFYQRCGIV